MVRPDRNSRTWIGSVLVIGVLLLGLTGCVKFHANLTIGDDDTISGDYIIAVNRELATADGHSERKYLAAMKRDLEEQSDDLDIPGRTKYEEYKDSTFVGFRILFEDVPLDDYKFPGDELDTGASIEHVDDEIRFEMNTKSDSSQGGDFEELGSAMASSMDVAVVVTFPGGVSDTNGEIGADGRTVTWQIDPNRDRRLYAVASDSSNAWILYSVAIGVLVLLAVGLVLLARRYSAGR